NLSATSGAISMSGSQTVSGTFLVSGASFSVGSGNTISAATVSMSSGTLDASGPGTITATGTTGVSFSGGTLTMGAGTFNAAATSVDFSLLASNTWGAAGNLNLNGSGDQTYTPKTLSMGKLTVTHAAATDAISLPGGLTLAGAFSMTNGTVTFGVGTLSGTSFS